MLLACQKLLVLDHRTIFSIMVHLVPSIGKDVQNIQQLRDPYMLSRQSLVRILETLDGLEHQLAPPF